MKIAILFSGHIRSYSCASDILINLRRILPAADVFIHTWNTIDITSKTHHEPYSIGIDIEESYLQKLKPKRKLVERQEDLIINDELSKVMNVLPEQMYPMLKGYYWMIYGIAKCTDLMIAEEQISGVNYDYVIRYRFDLICNEYDLILKDFCYLRDLENGIICSTSKNFWPIGVFSDVVWTLSRNDHVNIIHYLCQNMFVDATLFKYSKLFLPEMLFTKAVTNLGIKIFPSYGVYKLRRKHEDLLISRQSSAYMTSLSEMLSCWNLIKNDLWIRKSFFIRKKDVLMDEWKRNTFFPFNKLILTTIIFYCISILLKLKQTRILTIHLVTFLTFLL